MRKFVKLSLLLSVIFTSGCTNGQVADHFQEYTFTQKLDDKEKSDIFETVKEHALTLKKVTTKQETYAESEMHKATGTMDSEDIFYEDSKYPDALILETKTTNRSSQSRNGVTYNNNTTTTKKEWDSRSGYRYITTETKVNNDDTTFEASAYPLDTTISKQYKEEKALSFLPNVNEWDVYKNGDGSYTMINSVVTKNVSAVTWGKDTKEYFTSSKTQRVYSINKDLYLNSYYSYEENKTNRDPYTNAWYDSEKVISNSYTYTKYEYGTRDANSITSLNESVEGKEFLTTLSVNVYDTTFRSANLNNYAPIFGTRILKSSISLTPNNNTPNQTFQLTETIECRNYVSETNSSSYSPTYYYTIHGQQYELAFTTLIGTKLTTKTVALEFTTSTYIDSYSSGMYDGGLTLLNVSNQDYLANTSLSDITVNITFSYDGNQAVINSVRKKQLLKETKTGARQHQLF